LFNDPFDTQLEIRVGYTVSELADAFEPEILRWIFADDAPPEGMHPVVAAAVWTARTVR